MDHIFFNAHHSPIGAFATFTLGHPGAAGGFGIELGKPADQNVFIGLETMQKNVFEALPFFTAADDERARWEFENRDTATPVDKLKIIPFDRQKILRTFKLASDTWNAGDLTFALYSPVTSLPDPEKQSEAEFKMAIVPAIIAELTVDNTNSTVDRRAFFGFAGTDQTTSMRRMDSTCSSRFTGIGHGRHSAIITHAKDAQAGLAFSLEDAIAPKVVENLWFGGNNGAMVITVPAGKKITCQFAIGFHRNGLVTAGIDASYYYNRFFPHIESAVEWAMDHFAEYRAMAKRADDMLDTSKLSADQRFLTVNAIRSYYGSTELLDYQNKPFWVVNEGEYRLMNTFDLTVDQLFYEMKMNPWTVRNNLDMYASRYRYYDTVCFPGETKQYPGGISFTHDIGVGNSVSRPGFSAYEQHALSGCFSHMTHEQLVNWIVCGAVYARQSNDNAWLTANLGIFEECLTSLENRDHPDPARRTGIMKLDSSRCMGGAEITTYDSLDASLGQSRNNLYLGVKTWASYVLLESLLKQCGKTEAAKRAGIQADKCGATIVAHVSPEGYIPAVFENNNDSKIIPAIEGLVFPFIAGCKEAVDPAGRFGALIIALKKHTEFVLKPGICLFDNDVWKMSSTSVNSWPSKIYLCQFVARKILGLSGDIYSSKADKAHVSRLLLPQENAYWAAADQIIDGKSLGSRYYPRLVTCILWLQE